MSAMDGPARWRIVINPASGGGRAGRYWPRLRAALDEARIPHVCHVTRAAGDAARLAASAVRNGDRRLLALGGDGTFNELVNGVLAAGDGSLAQSLLAVAALGTGNDWARSMQVPDDPRRLAACMARGRVRAVDLGIAQDDAGRRQAFHTIAGAGLDAEVLRFAPRRGPRVLAYPIGLLRAIMRFRAPRFRITIDGREQSGRYWLALAANGPRCGGGMRLVPAAEPDDGWLDLLTVEPLTAFGALARLPMLFDGRLAGDPAFHVTRCRSATIDADPVCDVELDGQPAGRTPVHLTLLARALPALDCRPSAE